MTEDEAEPVPDSRYAWYVLAVLIVAYTLAYVDRTILSLMVAPIRASLHITDVQLSLLHGLAFAIFYTFMGIPLGRLVDRRRRTTIVAVGITLWSIMTAICGAAQGFSQMFGARVGVGVGEAALSPAAFSMLSDWFSGRKLTRALSLYSSGIYMGGGLATIAGGALIGLSAHVSARLPSHPEAWRLVFVAVALPGLLVAVAVATLREPRRRGSVSAEVPSLGTVLGHIRERRAAYGFLIAGLSFASMMWNGVAAWLPSHFIRRFGWTPPQVGYRYGLALFIFGTCGIVFGGWLANRLRDRGRRDANVLVGLVSSLAALPFGAVATLLPNPWLGLGVLCVYLFAGAMPYGAAAAAFQELTPNRMRGQVSAIYLFVLNLVGIGFGPTLVALLTEHVFGGDATLRFAIATVVVVTASASALCFAAALRPHREVIGDQDRASA